MRIVGTPKEIGNEYFRRYKNLDKDKEYILEVKEYKKNRSLDQNAIYWKLLQEFAKWGKEDINVLHNQMLSSYGVQTNYLAIVPQDDKIEKLSNIHLKRTSKTIERHGIKYEYCKILKGSHELKKDEMSHLIDGLKNEIIGSGANIDIEGAYGNNN